MAEVELAPRQVVRAEVGCVLSMDPGVEMDTSTGGGIGKGFTRMLTGESFFITDFTNTNPTGVARLTFGLYPLPFVFVYFSFNSRFLCMRSPPQARHIHVKLFPCRWRPSAARSSVRRAPSCAATPPSRSTCFSLRDSRRASSVARDSSYRSKSLPFAISSVLVILYLFAS